MYRTGIQAARCKDDVSCLLCGRMLSQILGLMKWHTDSRWDGDPEEDVDRDRERGSFLCRQFFHRKVDCKGRRHFLPSAIHHTEVKQTIVYYYPNEPVQRVFSQERLHQD